MKILQKRYSQENLDIIHLVYKTKLLLVNMDVEEYKFIDKMKVYYQKQCELLTAYSNMLKSYSNKENLKSIIRQWNYFNTIDSDRTTFYEYAFSSIHSICEFKPMGKSEECQYCIMKSIVYPYFASDSPDLMWCEKSPHWLYTLEALAISLYINKNGEYEFNNTNHNFTGDSSKANGNGHVTLETWLNLMMIELNRSIQIIDNSVKFELLRAQEGEK